ncbi:hypothetical protein EGR_10806 [Echinococcus granulosus]|uniref:Uncharacterized protein n=1 Tax=Echinococcus granulosus TaxID=6210 RepID=W6U1E5_ECHGR|nr:hypothetical protein EGR_10806 [Echinococcus granulosus]EUB54331.1 hypothetical protein EGR_10806 [Echinococcus granulosus]
MQMKIRFWDKRSHSKGTFHIRNAFMQSVDKRSSNTLSRYLWLLRTTLTQIPTVYIKTLRGQSTFQFMSVQAGFRRNFNAAFYSGKMITTVFKKTIVILSSMTISFLRSCAQRTRDFNGIMPISFPFHSHFFNQQTIQSWILHRAIRIPRSHPIRREWNCSDSGCFQVSLRFACDESPLALQQQAALREPSRRIEKGDAKGIGSCKLYLLATLRSNLNQIEHENSSFPGKHLLTYYIYYKCTNCLEFGKSVFVSRWKLQNGTSMPKLFEKHMFFLNGNKPDKNSFLLNCLFLTNYSFW